MCMYITSARGHELSGRVFADVCNLIYASYYYALALALYILCMIHERNMMLKAVLHSRLAV